MGNIATPNIIKASDINDLSINSLTTSGDITCNGNISVPSGSVTANQYYGTKFKRTTLLTVPLGSTSYTIPSITNYQFLLYCVKWSGDYSWTSVFVPSDFEGVSGFNNSDGICLSDSKTSGYLRIKITSNTNLLVTSVSKVSWFTLYGLK